MYRVSLITLAAIICCPFSPLPAQSTSIRLGIPEPKQRIGSVRPIGQHHAPNSSSNTWRRWESILSQPFPDQFNGQATAEQTVADLAKLGLPIILHQTAIDDSLTHDDVLDLKLPQQPLKTRLMAALESVNATLVFRDDHISIISKDEEEDSLMFMTITYDVSGMGINPMDLVDVVQASVYADSWQDTGQGLGTIQHINVRGKDLLIISQSYVIQSAVQNLFQSMNVLTGNRVVRNEKPHLHNRPSRIWYPGTSTPVTIPTNNVFPQSSRQPSRYDQGGLFNVNNKRSR